MQRTIQGARSLQDSLRLATKEPERAAYVAASAINIGANLLGAHKVAAISKSTLMPLLGASAYRRGTLPVGHAAAWLGDLVLIQPNRIPAGAAAFAIAHIDWIRRMRNRGATFNSTRAAARIPLWALGTAYAYHFERPLALPVAAYSILLGATSMYGDDPVLINPKNQTSYGTGHGGNLFLISDLLLLIREVGPEFSPLVRQLTNAAVMATYTLAQLMLTDGLIPAKK